MADYTSPADEAFFAAIGRLTLSWGHIEFGVDAIVAILHWNLGGAKTERVMPWALKRKIRYIKAYFRRQMPDSEITTRMCELLDEVGRASEDRHDLVHGFTVEHPEGAGEAKLVRLLRSETGKFTQKHVHVTTAMVLQHAVAANKLGTRVLEVTLALAQGITQEANQPNGGG